MNKAIFYSVLCIFFFSCNRKRSFNIVNAPASPSVNVTVSGDETKALIDSIFVEMQRRMRDRIDGVKTDSTVHSGDSLSFKSSVRNFSVKINAAMDDMTRDTLMKDFEASVLKYMPDMFELLNKSDSVVDMSIETIHFSFTLPRTQVEVEALNNRLLYAVNGGNIKQKEIDNDFWTLLRKKCECAEIANAEQFLNAVMTNPDGGIVYRLAIVRDGTYTFCWKSDGQSKTVLNLIKDDDLLKDLQMVDRDSIF